MIHPRSASPPPENMSLIASPWWNVCPVFVLLSVCILVIIVFLFLMSCFPIRISSSMTHSCLCLVALSFTLPTLNVHVDSCAYFGHLFVRLWCMGVHVPFLTCFPISLTPRALHATPFFASLWHVCFSFAHLPRLDDSRCMC